MVQFDWQIVETREYSRDETPSFVTLTTRSYLTLEGTAATRTADAGFIAAAQTLATIAEKISEGPDAGIEIAGFKSYRPYPVQAVWSGGSRIEDRTHYKLWLKQPLFVTAANMQQALAQLDLGEAATGVAFESLAEGTEIQGFSATALSSANQTLLRLQTAIEERGLSRLSVDSHREVYLDGVGIDHPVLVRLAIDPKVGQIDESRHAHN